MFARRQSRKGTLDRLGSEKVPLSGLDRYSALTGSSAFHMFARLFKNLTTSEWMP
jgi:hypothetical protein